MVAVVAMAAAAVAKVYSVAGNPPSNRLQEHRFGRIRIGRTGTGPRTGPRARARVRSLRCGCGAGRGGKLQSPARQVRDVWVHEVFVQLTLRPEQHPQQLWQLRRRILRLTVAACRRMHAPARSPGRHHANLARIAAFTSNASFCRCAGSSKCDIGDAGDAEKTNSAIVASSSCGGAGRGGQSGPPSRPCEVPPAAACLEKRGVLLATRRELFLRKLNRILDTALADELNHALLLQVEAESRVFLENVRIQVVEQLNGLLDLRPALLGSAGGTGAERRGGGRGSRPARSRSM